MAKYETYFKALRQAGVNVTGTEDLDVLKKLWKDFSIVYKETTGGKLPNLSELVKQYDKTPTIDFGREYIENFANNIEMVYRNTMSYIYENMDNTNHAKGQLASIAYNYQDEITNSYLEIMRELKALINSGIPNEVIAQAIADNVELDYTIGVMLQPPSDLIILFEETLEQIQGIWSQINTRIEELQEQAERELW